MVGKKRLKWADAAKGFAILLVVMVHLISKHYMVLGWELPGVVDVAWRKLSDLVAPIRMPLFFAISGFFGGRSLEISWRSSARPRIVSAYYLFLLWFSLHMLFFLLNPPLLTTIPTTMGQYILGMFWGYTSLWYLYALPVYFIVTKLFSQWRMPALMGASVVSVLSSTSIAPELGNGSSVTRNLVFFMAAAYLPRLLSERAASPRKNLWKLVILFVLSSGIMSALTHYVVATKIELLLVDLALGAAHLALGGLGVAVGVKVFALLAFVWPIFTRACAFIGRNTLPIYVLHLPILAGLNILLEGTNVPMALALVYPFIALAVVVAACLGAHRLLLVMQAGWLFKMPGQSRDLQVTVRGMHSSGR